MTEKVNVGAQLGKLGKEIPGVMGGFGKFSAEVLKDGALTTKTKELISVALAGESTRGRFSGAFGFCDLLYYLIYNYS